MLYLGSIIRLQIQTRPLKVGDGRFRRYEPAAIVPVESLDITPDGVAATIDGERVIDVHNTAHPLSRNRGGNAVSVCFSGHYAEMRERFGATIRDGIAGENVLIAFDGLIGEDDLDPGLAIETAGGLAHLEQIIVAAPCVEFSRYALAYPDGVRPDHSVAEALQFLNDGMRGYYASVPAPATLRVGDRVFVRVDG